MKQKTSLSVLAKHALRASTSFLAAFALFFAAAPCVGRLHEPEVPKALQNFED